MGGAISSVFRTEVRPVGGGTSISCATRAYNKTRTTEFQGLVSYSTTEAITNFVAF